jgi:hypothetical protein
MSTVRRIGEATSRNLRHEVHAVHATTGRVVAVWAAFAARPPAGWALRAVAGGVLVVTAPTAAPAPAPPARLRLVAVEAALRGRLAAPDAEVDLDQPVVVHAFVPAPSVLEIRLSTSDGTPAAGRTVTVRPAAGPALALAEQPAGSGIYRSPPTAWSAAFHPLDVRVGGTTLLRTALDVTAPTTRLRLVDPT